MLCKFNQKTLQKPHSGKNLLLLCSTVANVQAHVDSCTFVYQKFWTIFK